MKVGKRKLIAAGAGILVLLVAGAVAMADDLRWLLLLIMAALVVGNVGLAQLILSSRRNVERRLTKIEKTVAATVGRGLRDPSFMEQLRSLALPQEHLEQMLRTIEAGHSRIETTQLQQLRRLDDLLPTDEAIDPPRG